MFSAAEFEAAWFFILKKIIQSIIEKTVDIGGVSPIFHIVTPGSLLIK
jgi:hypothetical protein